jgi:predicted nuclease of restriction endonuclease-like (RecB) superfamily
MIGREIIEEEQKGSKRAAYGERLIETLSEQLRGDYGSGISPYNLRLMRRFYQEYPVLLKKVPIQYALRTESEEKGKAYALRTISESHKLGQFNPSLSWTHYRALLRIAKSEVRSFYEIEAVKNSWNARELERQISSLLYERLALSRDKKGLLKLSTKGHEVQQPKDVFKDPVIMEFLGLPESQKLVESDLEQALIDNLQKFLLELGKGFAFVSRQERLTLEGDHFYIDLVFYHAVLKCYVLIDLKTQKLTHQDLGQLQLYVNYYDKERCSASDNPTLGLILCTDKNDTVVKYTLGPKQSRMIFASRYKLHLPTEAELREEIRKEIRALEPPEAGVRKSKSTSVGTTKTKKKKV